MTNRLPRASARSAAEWFAVMRGPDAEASRAAFEEWRRVAVNADAYARLEATWDESRFLANTAVGRDRDLSRARAKIPPSALLAAGIALLTLLSAGLVAGQIGWLGPAAVTQPAVTRIAAAGELRTVRLSDGSRATLDRGAVLADRSTAGERHFVLERGRARFDVAHDPARPFLVDAGEGRVVAHGTVFDVGIEDGAVRVVLLRGSVEVRERKSAQSGRPASRFLAPGEELTVRSGALGVPLRAPASALAWPAPMVSFDAVPLGEAVTMFNRGGGQIVRLEGAGSASLRVSGAFKRDDPQGFADALAASFGLVAEPAADGSIVLRARAAGVR